MSRYNFRRKSSTRNCKNYARKYDCKKLILVCTHSCKINKNKIAH